MTTAKQEHSRALMVLVALLIFGSIPQLPGMKQQGRDSGIFAYTGHVILEGGLPYVDAWDNKPPGVYYINAMAFLVMGTHRLALWSIELAFNLLTAAIFFRLLRTLFHQTKPALIGAAIFTLLMRHPAFVGGGNFTESYALLPQVAGLLVGYHFLVEPTFRRGFAFGALGGLAFLIKPTTIGITLAFVPAMLIAQPMMRRQRGKLVAHLTAMVSGGLTVLGLTSAYLLAEGIFPEAFRAAIISPGKLHDWISGESVAAWETVVNTFLRGEGFHATLLPLIPFVIFGVYLAIFRRAEGVRSTLFIWMGLAFALDLLMANLSNRGYYHYYQTPMPAALLPALILMLDEGSNRWTKRYLILIGAAAAIAIVGFAVISDGHPLHAPLHDPLAEYVETHTEPDDRVLVWGASTHINFQSGRESPTPFTYGYPLIVPDYTTDDDIADFLRDLEREQPTMIVDRAFTDGERIPPLDAARRERWFAEESGRRDTFDLSPIFDFVDEHCVIVGEIEADVIYECGY